MSDSFQLNEHPVHYLNPTVDLTKIKRVVFDMDGTIYKGGTVFPFTVNVFETLEKIGVDYTFLTNNSSRSAKDYLEKVLKLGLKATPDNISTSATATFFYLKQNYPKVKKIYVLGTASLREEFVEHGYEMIDEYNETDEPELVVVAFDTTLTYDRLCKATYWIGEGKPYIATHPDTVCPTDLKTILVDCGAVQALIENVTKRRPEAAPGKPSAAMIGSIMDKYGLAPDEVMMVGDRIYTDLEMARRAKVVGVLVLTGEATIETLKESGLTPELVLDDISVLRDLLVEAKTK
ncbi:MAG: HAD-IIA family hydrolase [Thermoguttaceae bacterium]|jgi:HAD superfamily hydrolase (TIGR01450 family)|nr:HAD-IIA family hydrolase [Thermoguttaceae bacterium]